MYKAKLGWHSNPSPRKGSNDKILFNVTHQNVDRKGHHDHRDQHVGQRQTDDKVIRCCLQSAFSTHTEYNQHIPEEREYGKEDQHQRPVVVGILLEVLPEQAGDVGEIRRVEGAVPAVRGRNVVLASVGGKVQLAEVLIDVRYEQERIIAGLVRCGVVRFEVPPRSGVKRVEGVGNHGDPNLLLRLHR